jgi:Suppressor of fused protein (SUFU)
MRSKRGGSAFTRFKDKARSLAERLKSPAAPIQNLFAITRHIETYFGTDFFVLHEEKSALVHIDVNVVLPSLIRPYYTLLTSGMSDRRMKVRRGVTDSALAEVCLCLPKEWPINQNNMDWATPEFFWPIAVLKNVARYPHLHETWLSRAHTIGSIEHPSRLDPQGRFIGVLLLEPLTFPAGAERVVAEDGGAIRYLAVVPVLATELAFKRKFGTAALEERLAAANFTELLDPERQSVAAG